MSRSGMCLAFPRDMTTQTVLHAHKRIFISLSCIAVLAMSAFACDRYGVDDVEILNEQAAHDAESPDEFEVLDGMDSAVPNSQEAGFLVGDGVAVNQDTYTTTDDEVLPVGPDTDPVGALPAQTTIRHDWGDKKGTWDLRLNSSKINRNSRVFVSTSEGMSQNQMFIGAATYTVHNVAPRDGGVDIRLHIAWDSPIRVTVNYLIINP